MKRNFAKNIFFLFINISFFRRRVGKTIARRHNSSRWQKSSKLFFFFWGKSAVWCFGIKNHFVRRIKREKREKNIFKQMANTENLSLVIINIFFLFRSFRWRAGLIIIWVTIHATHGNLSWRRNSCTNWQNDPRDKSGYEIHFICKNNFSVGKKLFNSDDENLCLFHLRSGSELLLKY